MKIKKIKTFIFYYQLRKVNKMTNQQTSTTEVTNDLVNDGASKSTDDNKMQWIISQIDQVFQDGKLVPSVAHWRCTYNDGEFTANAYGTASVLGVAKANVQDILDHIWLNQVNKDETELNCFNSITNQRNTCLSAKLNDIVNLNSPKTPLEKIKTDALAIVDEYHTKVIQSLVGNPTQAEKDTWSMKLETAAATMEKNKPNIAGQTFLITAGIQEVEDWAKSVLKKAQGYAAVVGMGEKLRATARQAIKAATSEKQVNQALEASVQETTQALKAFTKT